MLAALLAAVPAAALAQTADEFTQGRDLRLAGKAAEAIPHLEAASRAQPRDADVWLNLGLAYSAADRLVEADRALAEAERLAPDYADVKLARARVAFFRGQYAEAERRLATLPASDETRGLVAQIAQARRDTPTWRLDVSASHAELAKGLPAQNRAFAALSHAWAGGRFATVSAENARQFGSTDTYVEATVGAARGFVSLGGTPDADFRPEWQVRAGVYSNPHAFGAGWTAQLGLDAALARYVTGDVRSLQPSITLARGERLLIVGRMINTLDENDDYRTGYAVRAVWSPGSTVHLSAGFADAPESTDGVTRDVRAFSLGAAFDAAPNLTLRVDGAHEDRAAYDRDEVTLGFTRRF